MNCSKKTNFSGILNKDKIYSIIYTQNSSKISHDIKYILDNDGGRRIDANSNKLSDIQQNMNFCPSYLTRLFVHSCYQSFPQFWLSSFLFLFFVSKSATHFRYYIRIFGIRFRCFNYFLKSYFSSTLVINISNFITQIY